MLVRERGESFTSQAGLSTRFPVHNCGALLRCCEGLESSPEAQCWDSLIFLAGLEPVKLQAQPTTCHQPQQGGRGAEELRFVWDSRIYGQEVASVLL